MWTHLYFYFVKDTDKPIVFCEGNVLIYYYWKPFGLSLVGYFVFQNKDAWILDRWTTSLCSAVDWHGTFSFHHLFNAFNVTW